MKDFIVKSLYDTRGNPSSKRLITFLGFLQYLVAFNANMFYGYKPDTLLVELLAGITLAGLSANAAEHYFNKIRS